MKILLQDLRFALRMLASQPAFAAVAILALAIGIGSNTAIYSIVNVVLVRALPYDRPDQLVVILEKDKRSGSNSQPVAPANFADLRSSSLFTSMAAAELWGATLTGSDVPEQVPGLRASAELFRVLGVPPALGRTFTPEEEEPGRNRVVLLAHDFWQRRFGGDVDLVGREISLSGQMYQVIGIMPPAFGFPPFWAKKVSMWTPLAQTAQQKASRRAKSLRLFARLKPGVSLEQAQANLNSIAPAIERADPIQNARLGISVTPLQEMVVGKVRPALLILFAAVGLVLLIACANVANLLLARSIIRQKEIAVRMSLGATRLRIARQMLTESIVLAVAGGSLGLALASFGLGSLGEWFETALPRSQEIKIDGSVLLFTLALSLFAAVLFGLTPIVQLSGWALNDTLKGSTRSVHGSAWTTRFRNGLVISQVALTIVLLVGAGLLCRSFLAMQSIDPGFASHNALSGTLNVSGTSVAPPLRQVEFYRHVLDQVSALPGVLSVAAINHLPLAGDRWSTLIYPEDQPNLAPAETISAVYRVISPGYFSTMKINLQMGRDFSSSDVNNSPLGAVISETLASQLWKGTNPVGKRLRFGAQAAWLTVIGVAHNVKQRDWTRDSDGEIYLSYLQHPEHFSSNAASSMSLVVRTERNPSGLTASVREIIQSLEPSVPFSEIQTLEDIVSGATRQPRVYATLLAIFAVSALLLACIGVYGVISYAVSQRTQEIGLRLALGATRGNLLRLVLRHAFLLVSVGAVIGLFASLTISRLLASLLYGVTSNDLSTFCEVSLILVAAALLAAYIPARRAAGLDPVTALRND